MRLAVISFTKTGSTLCGSLTKRLRELGEECSGYVQDRFLDRLQDVPGICPVRQTVTEWTGEQFCKVDGLIFIGAAGIAVRAIAPWLKDKMTDPAVVVLDERGRYAISLLSGHVGGANELANLVSEVTGAEAVVTTATDVNGKTAIDVWAKKRGLLMLDKAAAKRVAAELLEDNPVGFYSDFPLSEPVPDGFAKGQICRENVWITVRERPEPEHMISMFLGEDSHILRLVPRALTVGIGCRKGIAGEAVTGLVQEVFAEANLDVRAIRQFASIDIKAGEAGLIFAAESFRAPLVTYPAAVLEEVKGSSSSSAFVKQVTGTDNVCERAALKGAGEQGYLLVEKRVSNGVTLAVAIERKRI